MMTRSTSALASVALLCGLCFFPPACAESLDARCAEGACDPRDGAPGLDAADGGSDAPVDPCVDNPTDPKCLSEDTTLFVNAGANASTADGSRANPFKQIGAALAKVTSDKKRIYVCEGTYPEHIDIKVPVAVLGGIACDFTKAGGKPFIAPAKGIGVSILKAGSGVSLSDLVVQGRADTQAPGDSAIGAFVSETTGVLFRRVELKAGVGVGGANGSDGNATPNYAAAIATFGVTTMAANGGAAADCGTCVDGTVSKSGAGADSSAVPGAGDATPSAGITNAGSSGVGSCGGGGQGANAVSAPVAPGGTSPGALTASGWSGTVGTKGGNGRPGQGGGGGGSTTSPVLGGGSGGCGGCGGTGGGPGNSGGSSIALLVFQSGVTVEESTIEASGAGGGGKGGSAQPGQLRGQPGSGACLGGPGGQGSGGGGGGGGAGGASAAIMHLGAAPAVSKSTLKHGDGGGAGGGGDPGAGPGTAGLAGQPGAVGPAADVTSL